MTDLPSGTSSFGKDHDPDYRAQGQAALLLVESLVHSLLDAGVLTRDQVLRTLDSAFEVKQESLAERKEDERTLRKSLQLIAEMRRSMLAYPDGDGKGATAD